MRTRLAFIIGAATLSVSACASAGGAYGVGYASAYDAPGFDCYNNGLYGYGGYGYDNCGWYDGFFYPGFGNFVFDRNHHRHHMTGHQHDYFTRQARGPDGGRRVGLGSSGGVVPPTVSRPQGTPGNGMGRGFGGSGPRKGFGGGSRGGFGGGNHGGFGGSFGGSHGEMSGGFHGGGGHRGYPLPQPASSREGHHGPPAPIGDLHFRSR